MTPPHAAAASDRPVLELVEVAKIYGSGRAATNAVRGVSLAVWPGEFVAVMGPSGSGKSTLLHMAAGLEEPDAGTVRVDGEPVPFRPGTRWAELRRRRIGVLYQRLNLIPSLTALANVEVPLVLDGTPRREATRLSLDALGRVGVASEAGRRPGELSGGRQVLVGLARAIVGSRDVILADEPTGALDSASGQAVMDVLATRAAAGTSVLMVTHDSTMAAWADRIVTMRDGLLVPEASVGQARAVGAKVLDEVPS